MASTEFEPYKYSPTPNEQVVLDVLTDHKSGKKIHRAGGGKLIVHENLRAGIVTVETAFAPVRKRQTEEVEKAMEDVADVLKRNGVSCTLETVYMRCPCPNKVILSCPMLPSR